MNIICVLRRADVCRQKLFLEKLTCVQTRGPRHSCLLLDFVRWTLPCICNLPPFARGGGCDNVLSLVNSAL